MIPQQLPPRFVWFKLALELLDADNAGDELDVMLSEEIFVLTLGVFGEEADRGCRRRWESRVGQLAKITERVTCQSPNSTPVSNETKRKKRELRTS